MEVNRNCIFLLFSSFFLLSTFFGATQSHARSIQSTNAINDSGKESIRRALLESLKTSNKISVSKKDKKKKKKKKKNKKKSSAVTSSRSNPSLVLLFSTSLLGLVALLAC